MGKTPASELEYIGYAEQIPLKCHVVSIENSSPHWHHEYEVFFVLRGAVSIRCEEAEWRLGAGDIFLFNAGEIHAVNQPEPANLCLVLQFNPSLLSEVYETGFRFDLNTRSAAQIPADAVRLFRHDLARIGLLLYEKPNGYPFYIKGGLYHFIGAMFQYLQYTVETAPKQPDDNRLHDFNAIKQYIKQRFTEDISTDKMCQSLSISRATLYRILKEAGIPSYKALVRYYRVEHAKDLLRNTNLSIQYIASVSGFESDSSFYRIFKEIAAVSPSQYRVRPHISEAPVGIQGYASVNMPQAVDVLRGYCQD